MSLVYLVANTSDAETIAEKTSFTMAMSMVDE